MYSLKRMLFYLAELQPRVRGWLLASVGGKKVGMVPANYVKVLGRRKGHGRLKNPAQQAVHSTAETVARGVSQSSSVSSVSSASSQNFNNAFAPSASKQSGTISTSKLEDDYANIFDKASVIDRTASDILQENCTEDTAGWEVLPGVFLVVCKIPEKPPIDSIGCVIRQHGPKELCDHYTNSEFVQKYLNKGATKWHSHFLPPRPASIS